jgi:4Fe-4S ferredoxin
LDICPTEAIQITTSTENKDGKVEPPKININQKKCHYCGLCQAICPFGALELGINGISVNPVLEKKSFPNLVRDIIVNEEKCGIEYLGIKDTCPLDLIKVISDEQNGKVKIIIDKESCPCCRICEEKFPEGVIQVKKIFSGNLHINNNYCPENCHNCIDVCPIPNVLSLSKEGKVQVNEKNCVYCGVCKIACPEDSALELVRSNIRHTQVHSGAWNKALEKVASTKALTKELQKKTGKKLHTAVKNRFNSELLENDF